MSISIEIYTDGSCLGNPGKGGWACILSAEGYPSKEIYGSEQQTTNNRMELTAVIKGLGSIKVQNTKVTVYSDSQWVINCANKTWTRKANLDLWQQYDKLATQHSVNFQWVKSHSGNPENERCDQLARFAAKSVC